MAKTRRSLKKTIVIPPEKKEAQWLMEWAATRPLIKDVLLHVPNEGKRSWWEGKYLKSIGLRKGVSDYFLPIPTATYHGLWIELKIVSGGRITKEQKEWLEKMRSLGYAGEVANGWVHASSIITSYLAL